MPSKKGAGSTCASTDELPPTQTFLKPSEFPYWTSQQHIQVPKETAVQLYNSVVSGDAGQGKKSSSSAGISSPIAQQTSSQRTREALLMQYEYAKQICGQDKFHGESFRADYLTACSKLNVTPHPLLLPKRKERDVARVPTANLQSRTRTPDSNASMTIKTPSTLKTKAKRFRFWDDDEKQTETRLVDVNAYETKEDAARERIDIKGYKLDYGTLVILRMLLPKHPSIKYFNFHNCGLDQPMVSFLCDMVLDTETTVIEGMSIDFCVDTLSTVSAFKEEGENKVEKEEGEPSTSAVQTGDPGFIGSCVEHLLSKSSKLEQLSLRGDGLTEADADFICRGLVKNNTLKILNLFENNLGDSGAKRLAFGVRNNRSLEELSIANNNITEEGLEAITRSVFPVKCNSAVLHLRETFEGTIFGSSTEKQAKAKKGGKQPAKGKASSAADTGTEHPTGLPEAIFCGEDTYICPGNAILLAFDWSGNNIKEYSSLVKLCRKLAATDSNAYLEDIRDYDPEGTTTKQDKENRPSSGGSSKGGKKQSGGRRGSASKHAAEAANFDEVSLPQYTLKWINCGNIFAPKLKSWEIPGSLTPEEEAQREYEKCKKWLDETGIRLIY